MWAWNEKTAATAKIKTSVSAEERRQRIDMAKQRKVGKDWCEGNGIEVGAKYHLGKLRESMTEGTRIVSLGQPDAELYFTPEIQNSS